MWSILASKIEIEPKLLQTKLAKSLYQLLNQFCIQIQSKMAADLFPTEREFSRHRVIGAFKNQWIS